MVDASGVSVIVTNHNYRQYVVETVESALGQTRSPSEIVVVDDGSTDGSPDLLQSAFGGNPLVRLVRTANRGQLAALAEGVGRSGGNVVCFLDADDRWDPDYLAALSDHYARTDAADVVYSNLRYFGDREGLWNNLDGDRDHGLSALLTWMRHVYLGAPTSAISMRRTLALRILELPAAFFPLWKTRADDCLTLGASLLGARKYFLARPYVGYRVHGGNRWAGRSAEPTARAQHAMRCSDIVEFYARQAGLSERHLSYAHLEFATKPRPSLRDLRAYLWLQRRAQAPWTYRFWAARSMLSHYLRARWSAARASP